MRREASGMSRETFLVGQYLREVVKKNFYNRTRQFLVYICRRIKRS